MEIWVIFTQFRYPRVLFIKLVIKNKFSSLLALGFHSNYTLIYYSIYYLLFIIIYYFNTYYST